MDSARDKVTRKKYKLIPHLLKVCEADTFEDAKRVCRFLNFENRTPDTKVLCLCQRRIYKEVYTFYSKLGYTFHLGSGCKDALKLDENPAKKNRLINTLASWDKEGNYSEIADLTVYSAEVLANLIRVVKDRLDSGWNDQGALTSLKGELDELICIHRQRGQPVTALVRILAQIEDRIKAIATEKAADEALERRLEQERLRLIEEKGRLERERLRLAEEKMKSEMAKRYAKRLATQAGNEIVEPNKHTQYGTYEELYISLME